MSGFTLPVSRSQGRAIVVGTPACRAAATETLHNLGFETAQADNPYSLMVEICRRPVAYRIVAISLGGVFREELPFIHVLRQRFPRIEIWLSDTDGRAAALAEAMRMGADGLLSADGLHRFAPATLSEQAAPLLSSEPDPILPPPENLRQTDPADPEPPPRHDPPCDDLGVTEPLLTPEELRALLEDPSAEQRIDTAPGS